MTATNAEAQAATVASEISDVDRDSLYILPLSILPLETPALRHARMIKNAKLDSVVEMFRGRHTGSGQIYVQNLPNEFHWPEGGAHPDMKMLRRIEKLPSYDVYSLRISLRRLDIEVNDYDDLKLSEAKNRELTEYMTRFTRPLILEIYGDDDRDIKRFEDVLALFRSPDVKKALERLKQMAEKLEIRTEQVPEFLEDYGDIFLSLSYYRQCLDTIWPIVDDFLDSLHDLKGAYQFRGDSGLQQTAREMENVINKAMTGMTTRFQAFDQASRNMWSEISAERFREVESLIKRFHETNGGVLCSLSVKMSAWAEVFPTRHSGGPAKRLEFIRSEMRQGLEKIVDLEDAAPPMPRF